MDPHRNASLEPGEGRETHRFETPAVHELTLEEIERQRDLVRRSLLPIPRPRHAAT